jgi:hypothetical protein
LNVPSPFAMSVPSKRSSAPPPAISAKAALPVPDSVNGPATTRVGVS